MKKLTWQNMPGMPCGFLTGIIILVSSVLGGTFAAEMIQPRKLIDSHTAGLIPKRHYEVEIRVYPNGSYSGTSGAGAGALMGIGAGITNRLNIGLSYGGENVIGNRGLSGNPHLGGLVKFRLVEESVSWPGMAIGYDNQGYGGVSNEYIGYVYKSQGFFLALSKNYLLFSSAQIGFHGAVNYSMEEAGSQSNWPNAYAGLDLTKNSLSRQNTIWHLTTTLTTILCTGI
jgi:hypothetical protein